MELQRRPEAKVTEGVSIGRLFDMAGPDQIVRPPGKAEADPRGRGTREGR